MSESNPWDEQWFKAQQQFVEAWSDMAKSSASGSHANQSELWSQSFNLWRNACSGQAQPDIQHAMDKCFDMGKEYFAMAEQVSKSMASDTNPMDGIQQWMDQLKQSLQQSAAMPGFDGTGVEDFMKQWFNPTSSWQQMAAAINPTNQSAGQTPGMMPSFFNSTEAFDPLAKVLSSPGIGYFRESQEKQQRGIQLALEYQQANFAFNQAFLKTAIESIQGFQEHLLKLNQETAPKSLRELYDLWVEVSEEHYAKFAMSEEYQSLYGDMVNRLMTLKKHNNEITDDLLRGMNLPNSREVDTMQQRLQHLRRENFKLKNEIKDIRSILQSLTNPGTATKSAASRKSVPIKKTTVKKKATKRQPKTGA